MRLSLQIHRADSFALWGCAIASAVTAVSFLPRAVAAGPPLPDLVLNFNDKKPYVEQQFFEKENCAVDEGCVKKAGNRILLRFDTETHNIGEAAVDFGDPRNNRLFSYHDCHNHYHFDYFAHYRLRSRKTDKIVEEGNKSGFCLMDGAIRDPKIVKKVGSKKTYDCKHQGISAGFGDLYKSTIDCQWIDVTDVTPGVYDLEMEVNPKVAGQRRITESNYQNNIVTWEKVVIPKSGHSVSDRNPTVRLTKDDRKCGTARTCLKCMGDCRGSDRRCMGDLKCMKRDAKEKVPGCRGRGRKGWDYCYDPADEDNFDGDGDGGKALSESDKKCRTFDKCRECEGDCDGHNGRCKGRLVCMERDERENVPGCRGNGKSGYDYCYDPRS